MLECLITTLEWLEVYVLHYASVEWLVMGHSFSLAFVCSGAVTTWKFSVLL